MDIQSTALVFHQIRHGSQYRYGDSDLSVIVHDVRHDDSQPTLGPGRVFSNTDKQRLAEVLVEDLRVNVELLNPYCLSAAQQTLMWYRPRGRQSLRFQHETLECPLPSLVFLAHKGQLYVKAYKGERRPDANTPLTSAGMPNTNHFGSWCSGGNTVADFPTQRDIERIEERFFLSPFTHMGSERLPHKGPENMEAFYRWLAGQRRYPSGSMVSSNLTLGQWLKRITQ